MFVDSFYYDIKSSTKILHFLSYAALPVPAPPTNLRVTFINSTSVTISWQAPPFDPTITIASYRLVVSETEFGLNDTVASSTTTSYTFTGLEEYNNYTCSVVAVSTYDGVSNETMISFTTSQGGTYLLGQYLYNTVVSQKSTHGQSTLQVNQRWGWTLI